MMKIAIAICILLSTHTLRAKSGATESSRLSEGIKYGMPLKFSSIAKRENNLKLKSNTSMDLPVEGHCSYFYRCTVEGSDCILENCPKRLLFDPLLRTCNWSTKVNCYDMNPRLKCPEEYGDFELPGFCHSYLRCRWGVGEIVRCPGNMHWNPSSSQCQPPEEADCQLKCISAVDFQSIPGTNSRFLNCESEMSHVFECPENLKVDRWAQSCALEVSSSSSECWENTGIFPVTEDGRTFVECIEGVLKRKVKCPPGMALDQRTGECNTFSSNGCPDDVACPVPDGIFPDYCHGYCNRYVECTDGNPKAHDCPNGLFYDPYSGHCDVPENAYCKPKCPEKNGIFPYKEFFGMYLKCVDGTPSVEACPGNLVYNFASDECDLPENEHIKCTMPCERHPVPGICDQFIECDCKRGMLVRQRCSEGLHYNTITNQCDWPANAACKETYSQGEFCPLGYRYNTAIKECEARKDANYGFLCQKYPGQYLPIPGTCDIIFRCYPKEFLDIKGMRPGEYTYCSKGLRFNFTTEACDLIENVQCIDNWEMFSDSLGDDISLKDVYTAI